MMDPFSQKNKTGVKNTVSAQAHQRNTAELQALNEEAVAQYLSQQKDFYKRYPELFAKLQLSHGVDSSTSLLEKQNALLRKQHQERVNEIDTIKAIVAQNEQCLFALHYLTCNLLMEIGQSPRQQPYERAATVEFFCKKILIGALDQLSLHFLWNQELFQQAAQAGLNLVSFNDQRIAGMVKRLFLAAKPDCGPFNLAERVLLFPATQGNDMSSSVVLPVQSVQKKQACGLLILSSPDPQKFSIGQGTLFLNQLKRIIEHALGSCFDTKTSV